MGAKPTGLMIESPDATKAAVRGICAKPMFNGTLLPCRRN